MKITENNKKIKKFMDNVKETNILFSSLEIYFEFELIYQSYHARQISLISSVSRGRRASYSQWRV